MEKIKIDDIVIHKSTGYIGRVTFISQMRAYTHVLLINSRGTTGMTLATEELTKIGEMKA